MPIVIYTEIDANAQPIGSLLMWHEIQHFLPANTGFPNPIPPHLLSEHGLPLRRVVLPPEPTITPLDTLAYGALEWDAGTQAYMQTYVVTQMSDLAAAQAIVINAIEALAKSKRDAVVSSYSPAEMAAWGIKRAEALAYQASENVADASNLALEAQERQIPLDDLVDKVLAKAAALSALEAFIAGTCGRKQDAVRACATVQAVADELADMGNGWPPV